MDYSPLRCMDPKQLALKKNLAMYTTVLLTRKFTLTRLSPSSATKITCEFSKNVYEDFTSEE